MRPFNAGVIEPVASHPTLHGNDCEFCMNVVHGIEHLCEFAESHPVTHGDAPVIRKVLVSRLRHRPLHEGAGNRIWPIKYYYANSCFGCTLEKISQAGFVRVETDSCVLQVDHNRIHVIQNIDWRPSQFIGGTVNAVHRHPGGNVARVADVRSVECADDAMLRTEYGGKL